MKFFKGDLHILQLLTLITYLCLFPPVSAENDKLNFEALFVTEAEWDLKRHGAWMNEASLYGIWRPVYHSYIEAGTLHTYRLGNETVVNDLQGFSNISNENMAIGLGLLDYGFESTFGADSAHHLNIISGIRNVNEDYFNAGTATLFLNSSDGIFPTIAANYEMANFPISGVCPIHIAYAHQKGFKAMFSLYNGIAGKITDGSIFRFRPKKDGITTMSEISYTRNSSHQYMHYSLGLATNNTPIEHENGSFSKRNKASWWTLIELSLVKRQDFNVNLLLQGSTTLNKINVCQDYAGVGVTLCKTENNKRFQLEQVGFMNHYANFAEGTEWSQELSVKLALLENFSIKPCLQLIELDYNLLKAGLLRLCYEI